MCVGNVWTILTPSDVKVNHKSINIMALELSSLIVLLIDIFKFSVCDYHVHAECQDGALPNCRQASTYMPGRTLEEIRPAHYWREGNLPPGAKCLVCRKSCWSAECLAGWKCEWCGLAVIRHFFKFLSIDVID